MLAYSTISQLGYMVAAVGMGAYVAGMFHLATHAFFKALLFLSAGSIILGLERGHHHLAQHEGHEEGHEEVFDPNDMRNMGGMRKTMPVTFWVYLIGALSLGGVIPFAGFWSKDEILADAFTGGFSLIYWLLMIAAFLTAFYMGRQIFMVFFGEPRHEVAAHAEESPPVITIPLIILAAGAFLGGVLNLPGVETLTKWLEHTINIHPQEFVLNIAIVSTILALLAILFSWLLYGRNPLKRGQPDPLKKPLGFLFTGMERKWYVDEIYDVLFVARYKDIAHFLADTIDDRFWHDWFHEKALAGTYNWLSRIGLNLYADQRGIDAIANGLGYATKWLSAVLRKVQNGFVRSYALAVLLGVVVILGYLILK